MNGILDRFQGFTDKELSALRRRPTPDLSQCRAYGLRRVISSGEAGNVCLAQPYGQGWELLPTQSEREGNNSRSFACFADSK